MHDLIIALAPFVLSAVAALCLGVVIVNLRARQLADQRAQKSFGQWPEAEDLSSPRSTTPDVQLLPDGAARRVAPGLAVSIPLGEAFFFPLHSGLT